MTTAPISKDKTTEKSNASEAVNGLSAQISEAIKVLNDTKDRLESGAIEDRDNLLSIKSSLVKAHSLTASMGGYLRVINKYTFALAPGEKSVA